MVPRRLLPVPRWGLTLPAVLALLLLSACVALETAPPAATPVTGQPAAPPLATDSPAVATPTPSPEAYIPPPTYPPPPTSPPYQPDHMPTPTLTPLPATIVPPVQTVGPGQPLPFNRDLLLLDNGHLGQLVRWNRASRTAEVLLGTVPGEWHGPGPWPGAVLDVSLSADGRYALLLRRGAVYTATTVVRLDLVSREVLTLTELISRGDLLLAAPIALAPDGRRLALPIFAGELAGAEPGGLRPAGLPAYAGGARGAIDIYTLDTTRPGSPDTPVPVRLAGCGADGPDIEICSGFQWTPDSRLLAWTDGAGFWLGEPATREVRLVRAKRPGELLWYHPEPAFRRMTSWSADSRYTVLARSAGSDWLRAVLDTQTGELVDLAELGSEPYALGSAPLWLPGGRVAAVVRRADRTLAVRAWQVRPGQTPWLVPLAEQPLPAGYTSRPGALLWLGDGRLGVVLFSDSASAYRERGLFVGDGETLLFEWVASLPASGGAYNNWIEVLAWSPDGVLLRVIGGPDSDVPQLLYLPAGGQAVYDVLPALGGLSTAQHTLTWLPPPAIYPGLLQRTATFQLKERTPGFSYAAPAEWTADEGSFGVHIQNGGADGSALAPGEAGIGIDLMFDPGAQLTTLESLTQEIAGDPATRIVDRYTMTIGGETGEAFILSGGIVGDYAFVFTTLHQGVLFRAYAGVHARPDAKADLPAKIAQLKRLLDSLQFTD